MPSIFNATTTNGLVTSADNSGSLQLQTNNGTTAVTIDTSQNVGIGTTSPNVAISIARGASFDAAIEMAANGNTLGTTSLYVGQGNDNTSYLYQRANAPLIFGTNNTQRMQITSGGFVGIGTSSPGDKLTIASSASVSAAATFWANGGNSSNELYIGQGSANEAYVFNRANQPLILATNNSERMRITSAGQVCIQRTTALDSAALTVGDGVTNRPISVIGPNGVDGNYIDWLVSAPYSPNTAEQNRIRSAISGSAGGSGIQFMISNGFGSSAQTESFRINRTSCTVIGSLSKGSGSFKIDHPLPEKTETHHLVHSFIEGPQADLIYRGKAQLVDGRAVINIDESVGMTEGTFVLLNRDVQCFTSNETDWDAVRGSVNGNLLTIECQNNQSTATISWLVIGERQDKHMYETEWTDENGKVIVEPLKNTPVEGAE